MEHTLEQAVWSEGALLDLLGIDRKTLDYLRAEKGFPVVRVTVRSRVYLADDVLRWLKSRAATGTHTD